MMRAALRRHAATGVEVVVALVLAFTIGWLVAPGGSAPRPGAVDVGFAQDMAVHHEQALLMAGLAQTRGGPAVRAMADAIRVNQAEEIGMLRGWLRLWHEPSTDRRPMAWMPDQHLRGMAMAATAMPGMASPAQVDKLVALHGKAFDVLFLQVMIRHHEGGIEMARYAGLNAKLADVRDAARAMATAQIEDLTQLRPLLKADGGTELPTP
jgi:uncharacterized protein (DUF305 family)